MNKKIIIELCGDASAFLTMLAAIPYELGEAATYLPPKAKAWIVGIGVFSTFGLRILKRIVTQYETNQAAIPETTVAPNSPYSDPH